MLNRHIEFKFGNKIINLNNQFQDASPINKVVLTISKIKLIILGKQNLMSYPEFLS